VRKIVGLIRVPVHHWNDRPSGTVPIKEPTLGWRPASSSPKVIAPTELPAPTMVVLPSSVAMPMVSKR